MRPVAQSFLDRPHGSWYKTLSLSRQLPRNLSMRVGCHQRCYTVFHNNLKGKDK